METIMTDTQIFKSLHAEWNQVDDSSIELTKLSGTTNITYKVAHKTNALPPIIFKKFGDTEGVVNREKQNVVLKAIAEKKIGPNLYFADKQYRIQEFLANTSQPDLKKLKVLTYKEEVVLKMRQFHQLKLEISQNSTFVDRFLSKEFLQSILDKKYNSNYEQDDEKIVKQICSFIVPETIDKIKKSLLPKNRNTIKLCHNDVNPGNILVDSNKIFLIDYEYADYNYVAYDIANFLNECCIQYFIPEYPYLRISPEYETSDQDIKYLCAKYLETVDTQLIQEMFLDIKRCFALCNLYWAFWSILMNQESDFKYLIHGKMRIDKFSEIYATFIH